MREREEGKCERKERWNSVKIKEEKEGEIGEKRRKKEGRRRDREEEKCARKERREKSVRIKEEKKGEREEKEEGRKEKR